MINSSQDPAIIAATISAIARKRAEKLRQDAAAEAERIRTADSMTRRKVRLLLDSPTDR